MKQMLAWILIGSLSLSLLTACQQDVDPGSETQESRNTTSAESTTTTADAETTTTTTTTDAPGALGAADFVAMSPPDTGVSWEDYAESPLILLAMIFETERLPDGGLESRIPAYVMDDEIQEALDEEDGGFGNYESMTRNSDGSITITYSKEEYERIVNAIRVGLHQTFDRITETFSSYRTLAYNEDMSDVRVMVDSGQWRDFDAAGAMALMSMVMMYRMYYGRYENLSDFTFNYYDVDTGELVATGID